MKFLGSAIDWIQSSYGCARYPVSKTGYGIHFHPSAMFGRLMVLRHISSRSFSGVFCKCMMQLPSSTTKGIEPAFLGMAG